MKSPNFDRDLSEASLLKGLKAMKISLDVSKIDRLLTYTSELLRWNTAYNLSAVRDPLGIVSRHILDSLSLHSFLQQKIQQQQSSQSILRALKLVDIGTGAGFPGIPLAIAFPEVTFTLVDSNGKKTRFLFHVKTMLQLANVTIENQRAEGFQPSVKFDVVLSRAFASISDMISCSCHLVNEGGRFWAMKGAYPERELSRLSKQYRVEQCYPLTVPECGAERHLVVIA